MKGASVKSSMSPYFKDTPLVTTRDSIAGFTYEKLDPYGSRTIGQQVNSAVSTGSLNKDLRFHLSDPAHYVDWQSSTFEAELYVRAVDTNDAGIAAFLDNGGIHALIKRLVVKSGSRELMNIDNYNKLYNIWNLATNSKEYRNRILGASGDSAEDYYEILDGTSGKFTPTGNIANAGTTYTSATKTLVLNGGAFLTEVNVGDRLNVVYKIAENESRQSLEVASITNATTLIVKEDLIGANVDGSDADNRFSAISVIGGNLISANRLVKRGISMRQKIVQNTSIEDMRLYRVKWQFPFGIFGVKEYFPLPFLNSKLEIHMEFVEPALGLVVSSADSATTNKLGYKLNNPKFNVKFIKPHVNLFKAHEKMVMSEGGMEYRYMNYRVFENQLEANSSVFNVIYQSDIHSSQHILSIMTNQADANSASGNATATQSHKSQSTFNKNQLSRFRYHVGGRDYPAFGYCEVDDVASATAWQLLEDALEMNRYSGSSIEPWEWADVNSNKFIMACSLASENGVYLNGADTAENYIRHDIELGSSLSSAQTLFSFVAHDQVMTLSKNGVDLYF